MAEFTKKLNFKKPIGTITQAKAYSTAAEAGTNYKQIQIDGYPAFVAIGNPSDDRATSGIISQRNSTQAFLENGIIPYGRAEYWTPGTYTFTVPAGANQLLITSGGGGGGGGAGKLEANDNSDSKYSGGPGGRGGLISGTAAVTGGQVGAVVVGNGGAGGARGSGTYDVGSSGASGGTSSAFGVSAPGGGGGNRASTGWDGYAGTSYGNGGNGGAGGKGRSAGSAGSPGWVIIEYGGNI